jgi:hypothetical protein
MGACRKLGERGDSERIPPQCWSLAERMSVPLPHGVRGETQERFVRYKSGGTPLSRLIITEAPEGRSAPLPQTDDRSE